MTGLPIRREHGVDDDAGHRDLEPNREGEPGYAAMGRETAGQRQKERDQNHRQSHHRQADVRDEQREINHPDDTLALKMHVTVQGMICDVSHEEECRENKRNEHGRPVPADLLCPDEPVTDDQCDGG